MTNNVDHITQSSEPVERDRSSSSTPSKVDNLLSTLTGDRFGEWYRERTYRQNIENGTPYFNGPPSVPAIEQHSPSKLLKCHRQVIYQQYNAPQEKSDPDGIFWFGTRFEEDVAFPFLEQAITESNTYVQNSVWVNFRVETGGVELEIRGETDPLIVDTNAVPILPTEIKTKSSIEHTSSPNRSHRAQLHAYMVGLSKKYDIDLTKGVIMYGSRESLDVKIFHVEFDVGFWEDIVLEWAASHTEYRLKDKLPPADPEHDWECKFCAYRERCGKGDTGYGDSGPYGFLPGYSGYPKEKIIEYLEAHDETHITPSIAEEYPELAIEYDVVSWHCPECSISFDWDTIDPRATSDSVPLCPNCAANDRLAELRVPLPEMQSFERKDTTSQNEENQDE